MRAGFRDFLIARVGPGKIVISVFSTSHLSLTVGPTQIHLYDEAHKGVLQSKLRLSRQHQEVQDELESDRLVRAVTGYDKDALLLVHASMTELHAPFRAGNPDGSGVSTGASMDGGLTLRLSPDGGNDGSGTAIIGLGDARSPPVDRIPAVVGVDDDDDEDEEGFLNGL